MNKELYKALIEFDTTRPAVLCSLVHWQGSVPRKDYPKMLVRETGGTIGTIGGGSVEHAAIKAARETRSTGRSQLLNIDLRNTKAGQAGGICGGIAEVLIEPVTRELCDFYQSLNLFIRPATSKLSLTIVENTGEIFPRRLPVDPSKPDKSLSTEVLAAIEKSGQQAGSVSVATASHLALVEHFPIPTILHIFGAGHVGQAVAELAHFIDLGVNIYDDRSGLATRERFPHAELIRTIPFDAASGKELIAAGDYILIATRNHHQDLEQLRNILKFRFAWLGLMASRRKWKIISDALKAEGFAEAVIDQIHAPVGLDINSETVPEIAVSIIAEIIKHKRSHTG